MKRVGIFSIGLCALASLGSLSRTGAAQELQPPLQQPALVAPAVEQPPAPAAGEQPAAPPAAEQAAGGPAPLDLDIPRQVAVGADAEADRPVKPLTEGPLHEAFL